MVGDVRRAGMSISDNDNTGMFPHNHLQGLQGMVWYENENTLLLSVYLVFMLFCFYYYWKIKVENL